MTKTWWKEGIMYQIYPRSFKDSNGDGIGDLRGIIEKLDHLKDLGVNIIWLGPVYESPNDDNGYDISDYYAIMKEFGTMEDFDELLEGMHQRGLKLVMDLVVNHSSDEHEWFVESRKSVDNPYRDYYFWKKGKNGGPPNDWPSFFGGPAWDLDEKTGEYYLHLFTRKQPDLNWENEKLREEVYKLMRYWLDKGVDGFRMDVIPFISKRLDFPDAAGRPFFDTVENIYANGPRIHEFLQEMNKEVISKYDMMTVGEGPGINSELANLYVGESRNELNMIFHLDHMFLGYERRGKFYPDPVKLSDVKAIFTKWDKALGEEGWVNIFLDNHDFARMISRFGNDQEFRIPSAKVLATLILSLRGTPCIYQGSEIGMTNVVFDSIEDYRDVETLNPYRELLEKGGDIEEFMKGVHAAGRDNVRTPMQWDDSAHAGFTDATPWIKVNPNYKDINVRTDKAREDSIFKYYQQMISLRKSHTVLTYGKYQIMDALDEETFIYKRYDEKETFWFILNFSDHAQLFEIPEPREMQLLLCNYEGVNGDSRRLDPWECRVYRVG